MLNGALDIVFTFLKTILSFIGATIKEMISLIPKMFKEFGKLRK